MGRKIPGRKHRGVRDILEQNAKKEKSLVGKINAPPEDPDDQAIPKSLARIIELKQKIKDGVIPLKRKRKKRPALVTSAPRTSRNNKQSGRKDKPVPVFQQLPGESSKQFMGRVHCMVKNYLKENEFEQKYQVDIQRNELTGEAEGIKNKPKNEIDELMKKTMKMKNKKNKKEDSGPKLSKSQKRSLKLKAKKLKKSERSKPIDFEVFKDEVKFGEVVSAPPTLTKFPRKTSAQKPIETSKIPSKKILKSMANEIPTNESLKSGKRKKLSLPMRHMLEEQRKEAVSAYKKMKVNKESTDAR